MEHWGANGCILTIPKKVHKLGNSPSVECKTVKNGIEHSLGASTSTDFQGSTIYINSCTNENSIKVVLRK
ncbi:hypothetical protein [Allomuricauda sp. F6463D]|uniref:hypothetical protein n=1 Tax=Allomuricauda sp. F6463D TaxID=2926409 RepID=UPI001FF6DC0D|nr:hypothetical protein [Muricauda sp. F6463D]MCK0160463.1 hypothetical protein [Muricauda sp. F6463D]